MSRLRCFLFAVAALGACNGGSQVDGGLQMDAGADAGCKIGINLGATPCSVEGQVCTYDCIPCCGGYNPPQPSQTTCRSGYWSNTTTDCWTVGQYTDSLCTVLRPDAAPGVCQDK